MQIVNRMLAPVDRWAERRGMDPFWFYVVLFVFALGLLMLGHGVQEIARGVASYSWPGVEGVVTSAEVETSTYVPAGGQGADKGGPRTSHHPRICYTYEVAGTDYESCRYRFGDPGGQRRSRELVAAHPAGTRVAVFYQPDDPSRAVLERGTVPWSYYMVPLIGVIKVAVTGGILVWLIRRTPVAPESD